MPKILHKSVWLTCAGLNLEEYNARLGNFQVYMNKPTVAGNEVCMKLDLAIPESLFLRPTLQATIALDEDDIPKTKIDAGMADNLAELLSEQLGVRVNVSYEEDSDA